MPSSHHKKKSKSVEKSEKIMNIKAEPQEVQPLSFYVDDRVELIKQTFASLKTKTIKSICPGFLDDKSIENIQEQCLDEVLGISKKRLLSIINATKCPTDTESSSSDNSDVEKIEEHISLDEISSDDDHLIGRKSKLKKKKIKTKSAKKTSLVEQKNGAAGSEKNEKEYSVLELLELQARARAIRSQLALEPITKIELDSDQNSSDSSSTSMQSTHSIEERKSKNKKNKKGTDREKAKEKLMGEKSGRSNDLEPSQTLQSVSKPIRLKRNFRKRNLDHDQGDSSTNNTNQTNENEKVASNVEKDTSITVIKEIKSEDKPTETHDNDSRCSSPDLIPIVASPETLCISDSDDEKEKLNRKESAGIHAPVDAKEKEEVEKLDEPPEDGEILDEDDKKAGENDSTYVSDVIQLDESVNLPKEDDEMVEVEKNENDKIENENPIEKLKPQKQMSIDLNEADDTLTVDLDTEELDYEMKGSDDSDDGQSCRKNLDAAEEVVAVETVDLDTTSEEEEDEKNYAPKQEVRSFHERWLDSKKVSKILATSRLGNRLRDKIKSRKIAEVAEREKADSENSNPPPPVDDPIAEELAKCEEGSVKQYEVLTPKGDDKVNDDNEEDKRTDEENVDNSK